MEGEKRWWNHMMEIETGNRMIGNEYDTFPKELFPDYPFLMDEDENSRLMDIIDNISAEDLNAVYNSICNNQENNETTMLVEDLLATSLQSLSHEDYLTTPSKNIYMYDDMIEINKKPSELKEEKQEIGSEIFGNAVKMEIEAEQEKDEVFKPPTTSNTLPMLSYVKNKNKANIKTKNIKGKKKTKEDIIPIKNTITIKKIKAEEQEDCVDVETIPRDEIPILEAYDAKSLLEKFEACENPNPCNKSTIKNDHTYDTRTNKTCQMIQECNANISEKSVSQVSNQQPSILSKKIINKTKLSERRKTSPKIATLNIQSNKRKSTRMQDRVSCNKILKIDSVTVSNDIKNRTVSRTLVQLDHDYCNNDNFRAKSYNSNKTTEHISVLKSSQNENPDGLNQHEKHHKTGNSNEQCHLELVNIYDGNGKLAALQNEIKAKWLENDRKDCQKETSLKHSHNLNNSSVRKINISNASPTIKPLLLSIRSPLARKIILQSQKHILPKTNSIQTSPKTQYISVLKNPPNASQSSQFSINNPNKNIVTIMNNSNNETQNIIGQNTQNTPPHEEDKTSRVKISVLEYRKRILNDKTRNDKPMIMKESSRTILVDIYHASTMKLPLRPDQEIKDTFYCQREIMPCWKKESDIQEEKNKPKPSTRNVQTETDENIFEYLKSVDVEEEERDVKIMEINKKREENITNKKQKSCERVSHSLSRSRSKSRRCTTSESSSRSRSSSRSKSRDRRSRSKSQNRSRRRSRSKSKTRNRNRSRSVCTSTSKSRSSSKNKSSSRSRSRSRSRVDRRSSRRTISHRTRRSSVTSTSSWSSPASISMRSKHSYSRSSSQSDIRSRSRSRSRSPEQFYSKRSRSPSTSNLRRNKWSNKRRKDSRDRERSYDKYDRRERSYDKYEKRSLANRHVNRSYRSPLDSYSETYDDWHNRKKQREIEERRVVYVGRIDEGITKSDLRKRFEIFGPVEDISVHFREHGENYGFVTFVYNNDAYEAVEHGNDNPSLPEYTLSFGGRRAFCKSKYADLDNVENGAPKRRSHINEDMSYDYLLKSTAYMLKRKV